MKMNDKVIEHINHFVSSVGEYLHMEYDPMYYEIFTEEKNQSHMFDFVGSYYMGGSNVPDTSRYVVELILMNKRNTL